MTAKSCAANGQIIDHVGMFGTPACATTYADGGNVCSSKSDCLGECIIESDKSEFANLPLNVGDEVSGRCSAKDTLDGCIATIEGGKVVDHICID